MRIVFVAALAAAACARESESDSTEKKPGRPLFHDAAAEAGIEFKHLPRVRSSLLSEDSGSGACFVDFDGDGDLDVFLVNFGASNALLRNVGGTFEDVTKTSGLGGRGDGMGCLFGDVDNDGDQDLFLSGFGPDSYWRNEGDGTFVDATAEAGLRGGGWGMGASFGDYDLDGDIDLYVPRYVTYKVESASRALETDRDGNLVPLSLNPFSFEPQGNTLYRNEGGGRFKDVTAAAGVRDSRGRGMQAVFADLDHDGYPDIYVANDISTNVLFHNRGDGTFVNAADESWTADFRSSMGIAVGDFDNDLDQDMLVTHWIAQMNALYMNVLEQGPLGKEGLRLHFSDVAEPAGLGESSMDFSGWGVGFFDADNDGYLDVFIANGSTLERKEKREELVSQKNLLFHNNGDGTFSDVSERCGEDFNRPGNGRGAAFGDYDGDGDIDILLNNANGAAQLLRNDWNSGNHWLKVRLRGTRGNRDGVGARVEITLPGGARQVRMLVSGGSFLSSSSPVAHFGLGRESRVEKIVVHWPGGGLQTLTGAKADQTVIVIEGKEGT